MTVARLAVQPAPSKAMRTSTSSTTTTTITANDSIDPKATLRLTSSPSPNDKGKGSPTSLASSTATAVSQRPSSSTAEQQELPLFTPIWDYDRFPIGPCVRENNRSSQEHENPFLMLEYHQQNHRPQSNGRPNPNTAQMMRSGSSSSSASASSATSFQQQKNYSKQGSSRSSSSSRHRSRKNLHINVLGKSLSNGNGVSEFLPGASFSAPPSPSLNVADPSISPDLLLFFQPPFNGGGDHHHLADLDQEPNSAKPTTSATAPPAAPVPTSKFDLYKAQMDRVRSSHRLHGRSASASVSVSSSSPTTTVKGGLPFPSTPSSSVYSPPSTSSPTTIYTPSSSSSVADSFVASSNTISKKGHHQHTIFPKLFKKPSLSKSSRIRNLPTAQPPTPAATATPSIANSNNHSRDGSRASLSLSRRESRSIEHPQLQRSPIEEQQDRWREEWLRPSGAIHSMFRDGPSKFNCPHCGAMKVVSNIQYVPGLMSYLVAFGLMFLTLGTLSYLPFRKDHEGTKDCIHWCPECERKVARFNRANSTWEWI